MCDLKEGLEAGDVREHLPVGYVREGLQAAD